MRPAVLALALATITLPTLARPAPVPWPSLGERVLAAAEQERAAQRLPSVSIGIVDKSGLVWSGAVGHVDRSGTRAPDVRTLYRVGSVSKLFTDIIAMQLVERGQLDLDSPVRKYLPDFAPANPFGTPITLRQLMSHRSGLVREPPRGNYFDMQPVTLRQTVSSLNSTTLVAEPGTTYKYSNAGLAVVGRVLEVVTRKSFEQLMNEALLKPLSMHDTALRATPAVRAQLAHAQIAPFDAERFDAPVFDLGMAPAGNLYSNIEDMSRFAVAILNGGATEHSRILGQSTLTGMWERQYPDDSTRDYGIGFVLSSLDGHRVVGHGGAVYGYVTDLAVFPDDGFAVIVMIALDEASHAVARLRTFAARQVFAALGGETAPRYTHSDGIPSSLGRQLSGHYSDGEYSLDVRVLDGRTYVETPDTQAELRREGEHWVLDDVTTYRRDVSVDPKAGTLNVGGRTYRRASWTQPAPPPRDLAGLIGEYGWAHNALRVYERDGQPYVRIEWSTHARLERVAPDVYRFADVPGMYALEQLHFSRGADGIAHSVSLNGIVFGRRDFGAEMNARIEAMVRSQSEELRAGARSATPPAPEPGTRAPELVEVNRVEPGIRLDIRYASTNNFMGIPFYRTAQAFLQKPAAEALGRAHRRLVQDYGYGILIHDGYRPWFVTRMFWDATPPEGQAYVADPSEGSRHNRGCAADITLFDVRTGEVLETAGRYDEMSARSSPLYLGGSSLQRWRRDLLKNAVEAEGYAVYTYEWWHFDYHSWRTYPVLNLDFSEIGASGAAR